MSSPSRSPRDIDEEMSTDLVQVSPDQSPTLVAPSKLLADLFKSPDEENCPLAIAGLSHTLSPVEDILDQLPSSLNGLTGLAELSSLLKDACDRISVS